MAPFVESLRKLLPSLMLLAVIRMCFMLLAHFTSPISASSQEILPPGKVVRGKSVSATFERPDPLVSTEIQSETWNAVHVGVLVTIWCPFVLFTAHFVTKLTRMSYCLPPGARPDDAILPLDTARVQDLELSTLSQLARLDFIALAL